MGVVAKPGLWLFLWVGWFSLCALWPANLPAQSDEGQDPLQMLENIEKRRKELDERARILDLREEEIKRIEERMQKRIASLEELRDTILKDFKKEKDVDNQNITRLAKIFTSMKIKEASTRLKELDRETAIKVLRVMPEKTAAKILGKMDKQDAVELGNALGLPISEGRSER